MAIAPSHPAPPLAAAEGVRQVHAVLDRCGRVDDLSGYAASSLVVELDRAVRLATALDGGLPATREALNGGDLTPEHALVIATTAQQLPTGLDDTERAAIEQSLVAAGKRVDPVALRRKARRALESAHRSRAEVDAHEDAVLRSEEDRALAATRLTLHDNHDGTTTGHFTVPTLAGQILTKVIQQIASPRRFAQQAARDARQRAASQGAALTADQVAEATWDAFRAEDLDWSQKYGRAFVELLEHLPTDHLSGKVNATVLVTLDHDQLKTSLGAAHLDTGHDISASEGRRLACGAGLVPAVLDGQSQLLDLGRTQRFFTEAQRVALSMTYDTCAAQDCDRPYAWTEQHHHDPWASGGHTNLDKAVPLCGFHHRRVHHPGFHHHIDHDPDGRKGVTIRRRSDDPATDLARP